MIWCEMTEEIDHRYREEHRKRVSKSGRRCAFFEMLEGPSKPTQPVRTSKPALRPKSRATSQSLKKLVNENEDIADDALSSDELSELTVMTTATSKRTTRASSVPTKTPASRKSTRSTGTSGHRKATGASEIEDGPDAGGTEVGKRVSKSKKKNVEVKPKERIEAIEEVDEDVRVEVVEEPIAQKPKRGRPPGKTKAKTKVTKAAAALPDDVEVDTEPRTTTQLRNHSRLALESDSETPPLTKPTSSQPKSKTSSKSTKVEDIRSENENHRKKAVTKKALDDGELMPPPKTRTKLKASAISKARAIEVESDEEDLLDSAPHLHVVQTGIKKTPPNRLVEKPPSSVAQHDGPAIQAKGRKSSSTSEDAGYATAEHFMDVDDGREDRQPVKNRNVPEFIDKLESNQTSSMAVPASQIVSNVDVEMSDSRAPAQGQKTHRLTSSTSTSSLSKPARKEATIPFVRVSSRTTGSLARPPSRIGTEVVDISSDDDDELDVLKAITGMKPSSTSSATSVLQPPSSSSSLSLSSTLLQKAPKQSAPLVQLAAQKATSPAAVDTHHMTVETSLERHTALSAPLPDIDMSQPKDEVVDISQAKISSIGGPKERSIMASSTERTPSPSNNLPDTSKVASSAPALHPAPTLPSFDEDIAAESHVDDPAVDTFTPFLSVMAVHKLTSLTEDEGDLTIEQYIRRELDRQYQQFKEDGERQVALFKQRAAETRKRIMDL
jgi:hypothetical protein